MSFLCIPLLRMRFFFIVVLIPVLSVCWTTPVSAQVETPKTQYLPSISLNDNGSWAWTTSESLSLEPSPRNTPVLAVDSLGRVHALWDTRETPHYIYHTYQTHAGWTEPKPVFESLGASSILHKPLVLDDGTLHLIWRTNLGRDVDDHNRLLYSVFDGYEWRAIDEIYGSDTSWVQGMVHTTADGEIRLTVIDGSLSAHAIQMTPNGSGWSRTEPISPGFISSWVWPDMEGGIRFYGKTGSQGLLFTHWKEGVLVQDKMRMTAPGSLQGTSLDSNNNLHFYWKGQAPVPGGTEDGLFYQCLRSDLTLEPERILSGYNKIIYSMIGATDRTGQFALLWNEENRGYRLGLWQGCLQVGVRQVPIHPGYTVVTTALYGSPDKFCVLLQNSDSHYKTVCATYVRAN